MHIRKMFSNALAMQCSHLQTMNTFYILLERFIDQPVLLHDRQAFERVASDFNRIERPTSS